MQELPATKHQKSDDKMKKYAEKLKSFEVTFLH